MSEATEYAVKAAGGTKSQVKASKDGTDLLQRIEGVNEKLRALGSKRDVDPVALKRETRRLLVLMLAGSGDNRERLNTIEMLVKVEGYSKLTIAPATPTRMDDPKEVSRLAALAMKE